MKIETSGPISFMVAGVVIALIGALIEKSLQIDPSAAYVGGGIIFVVGLYLSIDRKRAKNLFRFGI